MKKFRGKDVTGQRHGKLVALRRLDVKKSGSWLWECQCDCGRVRQLTTVEFADRKSCGCLSKKKNGPTIGKDIVKLRNKKFKENQLYQFSFFDCEMPIVGKLVQEYQKSACFEVVDTKCSQDKAVMQSYGNKVVVSKKTVRAVLGGING